MKIVAINGFNSYIGKNFRHKYNKKYKILHYKENINNFSKFKLFTKQNKFNYFIHFASLSRSECETKKVLCKKTNYLSLKKIIKHFNNYKIKPKFIFLSSSHVYNNSNIKLKETHKKKPDNLYGKLKLDSENYIKNNYENYCILRIFNVYGNNQPENFFIPDVEKKTKNNKIIKLNKSIRDFIHINDVIKIIGFVINKNLYDVFNVGSGKSTNLSSLVKVISKKIKIKPIIIIKNRSDKLVANIEKLRSAGYKNKISSINKKTYTSK